MHRRKGQRLPLFPSTRLVCAALCRCSAAFPLLLHVVRISCKSACVGVGLARRM